MLYRRSSFLIACFATISTLVAPPSTASAEVVPDAPQSVPFDQTAVRKVNGSIAAELREGYVFPDRGAQAADALEKALAANAYAGVTDPAQFALQLTEQLRAITKDSHMRVSLARRSVTSLRRPR